MWGLPGWGVLWKVFQNTVLLEFANCRPPELQGQQQILQYHSLDAKMRDQAESLHERSQSSAREP